MKKLMKRILVFALLLLNGQLFSQVVDVMHLLDSSAQLLQNIESYSADILVKVDVDFIRMPDKKAHIEYRSPDHYKVESDGFLILPKMGMKPMLKQFDTDKFHAVFNGEEVIEGANCVIVNLVPKERKSKVALSTFWIRKQDYRIVRVETFTKKSGSFLVDLFYKDDLPLPSEMHFSFEVSGFNIPVRFIGKSIEMDKAKLKDDEVNAGKVIVTFSNYSISFYN